MQNSYKGFRIEFTDNPMELPTEMVDCYNSYISVNNDNPNRDNYRRRFLRWCRVVKHAHLVMFGHSAKTSESNRALCNRLGGTDYETLYFLHNIA